ncbi:hypothetical protein AB0I98_16880 [Streptomyces sp. NPDC050211]|uniref:hypothetical protein n=1 Tax=Streptomyces sp. NPDC050211 TaxID=3154932 RepID=UPI003424A64D
MTSVNEPERYHLTLNSANRPVQHGWWGSDVTARAKFTVWVGEHGSMPGARLILVDEVEGRTLAVGPEEA